MSSSERAVETLMDADPAFVELCDVLYGPSLDPQMVWADVFAKRGPQMTDEERRHRTEARIGLATNYLGLAAGAAGTVAAAKNPNLKRQSPRDYPQNANAQRARGGPVTGRMGRLVKTPKGRAKLLRAGAAGALGLQVANVAGDAVANRVLGRSARDKVQKDTMGLPKLDKVVAGIKTQKTTQAKMMLKPTGNKINATPTTATPTRSGAVGAPGVTPPAGVGGGTSGVTPGQGGLSKGVPGFVAKGDFSKFDDDQRLAFGWASVVEKDGIPVIDRQGDYISAEDMEKAAYVYVEKSRVGGDMHKRNGEAPHHVADLVESMVFTRDKISKMGLPDSTPVGWWVGFRVNDEEVWKSVKQGGHTGFSIHGKGKRVETTVDDVMAY